ncbi:PREDICTED: amyloid beta A4 precursor protein-binding family B member 1-interacting protein-like [Cercocebus atys]|uniref:amyloid beta A4 precursor protein-binding family B member 1-interacting protein-like n=1 Tax=Cercocebus atys TaxID=9531 RepID=UPI0005F4028A|nr:PREDICTED: amyloid beta A4 precursor protein-binding family B member 1-interacting protein-like [Cercocebus atys]
MSQALCQKDKLKGPIKGTAQPNGQMPQAAHSVSAVLQEAQTHAETSKDRKPALRNHQEHPRPHTAPSPACPSLWCRGPGTPSAAPSRPPRPRALAAGASSPRPTTSCRHCHRCLHWTTQSCRHPRWRIQSSRHRPWTSWSRPPPDFVPAPPAVVKRPPMPHPPNRHEASMFRTNT